MRPRALRRKILLAGFGAVLAGAMLGTGVAKADAHDDAFIAALDEQGITASSATDLITNGHTVCEYRDHGYTEADTAAVVISETQLTAYDAGYFVGAAEAAYCPWHYSGGMVPA